MCIELVFDDVTNVAIQIGYLSEFSGGDVVAHELHHVLILGAVGAVVTLDDLHQCLVQHVQQPKLVLGREIVQEQFQHIHVLLRKCSDEWRRWS